MNAILITILSIILMIAVGYFLKRINFLTADLVEAFNKLVINIFLPCMIFSALYSADLSLLPSLSVLPFVIFASSFVTGIISFLILKKLNFSDIRLWSILVTVMIANTAFMGYPINLGILGHDGFLRAIFCDISTMFTFLILSFVLALKFGGSFRAAIRKILFFMPLWAIIIGFAFNMFSISIGPVFENVVNYFSEAAIPLIMISLGLSIEFEGMSRSKHVVMFTSVMKLMIFPLIAFCIVSLLGLVNLEFNVTVIEAAMPSGLLSLVLAITYNLDSELTSDCIFMNTVFSLLTLPVIVMLL